MATEEGRLISINVGGIREFEYRGHPAFSAIWKTPVDGPVAARGVNLEGDDQADREAHGGPDKAVYAYALEDYRWWENQIDRRLQPGQFGENLTTEGIDVSGAIIGEQWAIGNAVLEVSEPRVPCWRFAVRMEDPTFPKKFTQSARPGSYLRIVTEGELQTGDRIRMVHRPGHRLSVADMFRIYTRDRSQADRLLEVPQVSEAWRLWASRVG